MKVDNSRPWVIVTYNSTHGRRLVNVGVLSVVITLINPLVGECLLSIVDVLYTTQALERYALNFLDVASEAAKILCQFGPEMCLVWLPML